MQRKGRKKKKKEKKRPNKIKRREGTSLRWKRSKVAGKGGMANKKDREQRNGGDRMSKLGL